jgi:hypothetical protein
MTERTRRKRGRPWWDVEIEFYIKERGVDPDKARMAVILRWMGHGDFRPLIDAIDRGHIDRPVLRPVLTVLVGMLEGNKSLPVHLKPLLRRRGRAVCPENWIRNLTAARAYEAADGKSDDVFADLAKTYGKSDRTIRRALTASRKSAK